MPKRSKRGHRRKPNLLLYLFGAVAAISTTVLLYKVFLAPKMGALPLQNEEKIVWEDYKGRKREIVIHRKIETA